jgi:hypothetical protein
MKQITVKISVDTPKDLTAITILNALEMVFTNKKVEVEAIGGDEPELVIDKDPPALRETIPYQGTETGRFQTAEPNEANVPKEAGEKKEPTTESTVVSATAGTPQSA